ncbi:MAG: 3-phosphoshikimate 1-carboxyvinyltransferase [Polyangiaceae bacterium]|nr:3-phosphoshikimate 1-carboxyvinyltransferase [Polyangiaceae bacterium]
MTGPLSGSVPLPADKSITHRALLLAAIADGESRIGASLLGADNLSTAGALRAMGVHIDEQSGAVTVRGNGLFGLRAPAGPIDCGNSGTTMRLLCGILAAQRFFVTLTGDASLSSRPMERVLKPLRLRGARAEGKIDPKRPGECTAPLHIGPLPEPHVLSTIEYEMPVSSAQVKSALLLSGLFSDGPTYVREPLLSRDHTERMLTALGVPLQTLGPMIELDPSVWSGSLPAFDVHIPGDLSAAAFLVAAAQIVPQSRVDVRNVGLNPTRSGFLDVLRDMGGAFEVEARGEQLGEPMGLVRASSSALVGARIGGESVARSIDEMPILAALAACASGITTVTDAAELRVKETDRLSAVVQVLRAFGVRCDETPDGLVIEGRAGEPLIAADVHSRGDHRIAMTAAILGLVADGKTRVQDANCIRTSFPKFVGTLRALGATISVEETA